MATATDPLIMRVMESMGWTDGSLLPIANEENRKLMEMIARMTNEKTEKSLAIQREGDRYENMQDHIKTNELEFNHNLVLIHAHESHMRTEHHFYKLAEHEESRLKQQLKHLEKEHAELKGFDDAVKNDIKKKNANMEKLSEKIKWSQKILSEWRELMANGEAANDLIAKYCKTDAARVESIEAKRNILQKRLMKQKTKLINTVEQNKTLTKMLERTEQLFNQAHVERRDLVNTWKDAVNQMIQRTRDIENAEKDIETEQEFLNTQTAKLKMCEDCYESQLEKNRVIEMELSVLSVEGSQTRNRLDELQNKLNVLQNEYIILCKLLQSTAQNLMQQQTSNLQKINEESDKKNYINAANEEYDYLYKKYGTFKECNSNSQDRLKQINEIIDDEERNVRLYDLECTRLTDALARATEQVNLTMKEAKALESEIESTEKTMHVTRRDIEKIKKERLRYLELSYDAQSRVYDMAMRISYMEGQTGVTEETLMLQDFLFTKEETLKKLTAKRKTLQMEILKQENKLIRVKNVTMINGNTYEKLLDILNVSKITLEASERELKQAILDNQDALVEESLVKVRLYQMHDLCTKQNDKFFNLGKHKADLEQYINSRLVDINAHKDVLLTKRRCMIEERSQLRADMADRMQKIDQLKKRYECATNLLGKNDDGTEITATQIKIKTAQEKNMLFQEGNELNALVMKAEEDIKAMENTLRLMNFSNEHYKKSFTQMDSDCNEMKRLNDLENEYCQALTKFKALRTEFAERSAALDFMAGDKLDKMFEDMEKLKLDKCDLLYKLEKELTDQSTKLQRAERELKSVFKSVKMKMVNDDVVNSFERDLNLRELEDRNNSALQQLAEIVDNNPFMNETVLKYFCQHGLKMPESKRMKSQASCRSDQSTDDFSMRVAAVSKKRTGSTTSSVSSKSSVKSQSNASINKTTPAVSVVTIDFPIPCRDADTSASKLTTTSAQKMSFSKK